MSDSEEAYPVIVLEPNYLVADEQMGSKKKYWLKLPDDDVPWLFKFSRPSGDIITGEHWAEKIASEVAELLGVPHAKVSLALLDGQPGSLSRKFEQLSNPAIELVHGNDLLAGHVTGYDRLKQQRQINHTVSNIITVVARLFPEPQERDQALRQLAGYLLLDALIVNTDRHHENWAVLRMTAPGLPVAHAVAPSFDHASSLARNETPQKLAEWTAEGGRVAWYVNRAHGGVYIAPEGRKGANPLAVVETVKRAWPRYLVDWYPAVAALTDAQLWCIVDRVPDSMMAVEAKNFVKEMLSYTLARLKEILR